MAENHAIYLIYNAHSIRDQIQLIFQLADALYYVNPLHASASTSLFDNH